MAGLKDGICTQCGSDEVYSGANLRYKHGGFGSNTIPVSFWDEAELDNYICVNCGYLESYVSDQRALEVVKKHWVRVKDMGKDEGAESGKG